MRTLLPIFIPILLFCSFLNGQQMVGYSVDDGNFKFELPAGCEVADEEFLESAKGLNQYIRFMAACPTGSGERALFAVSKFTDERTVSIDEAYQLSVEMQGGQNLGIEDSYKLIDHKVYQKDGKTLRYKISEYFGENVSIMFYFMKNDFGNELYEIKFTGKTSERDKAFDSAEKIALSVDFK